MDTTAAYFEQRTFDRLMPVDEVAAVLAVSTATVRRIVGRGELAAVRVGERQLRIPANALAEYLDRHEERGR